MLALLHSSLIAALVVSGSSTGPVTSTILLKTSTTWNGAPITYSAVGNPEVQTIIVEIAPGATTAWHMHPINNIANILEGIDCIELEDGAAREFKTGESFAEVVNTWHRGVNLGVGTLKILVVYTSEVGRPISIPKPAPESGTGAPQH